MPDRQNSHGRRNRRKRTSTHSQPNGDSPLPSYRGLAGGSYTPLSQANLNQIDRAIRHILSDIGFSDVPKIMLDTVLGNGGRAREDGRLCFPEPLLESYLANANRNFRLCGQKAKHDLHLSGKKVYVGTGGAAPQIVDIDTGHYRDSTLKDLYDAARLCDSLEHIHFFSRSLVARDMPNEELLDINTAYVCLAGTTKHVMTSISDPQNVAQIAQLCFMVAGSPESFQERPFLSLNINHAVPPLRFDEASCEVMAEAVKLGIPVHANVFGQVGASSPVTLAAAVAQNIAESLAGMIFAWLINPQAKVILGARPMITDLRTGGLAGGSGASAIIMAATTQMAQYYDLPNSCIAGATDSKIGDAQSGYEKALTISLAAQSGSNMITQACGMHAGLMSVALESYVIDNDMLGAVLRTLRPLGISDNTLATRVIEEVVTGEGHFLGHPTTYQRMQSDFVYPDIADRRPPAEWEADGGKTMQETAVQKTKEILKTYYPDHLSPKLDRSLRELFDIRLSKSSMNKKRENGL